MNPLRYIEKMKEMYEGERITTQEPRNMAQAPIAEDLEPGALRDEMLKGFDPSQETHEEYLQRINLERPFNAAQGGSAGQLVRNTVDGSRPGYAESKYSKFTPSVYDNLTEGHKKFYKEITGKTWNKKDWAEGNYRRINLSRKAKDVVKKTQKLSPYYKKVGFFDQYANNQRMLLEENKLLKRGYVSARKLNEMLGRPLTEGAAETLVTSLKESPWLDEIEGVKKWKKSKLLRKDIKIGGGSTFFKMPDKTTFKGLKNYYKNQEYLSKFKEGKIRTPTINAAKVFYDDKVLMNNLRKWSGNTKEIDKSALKVLNSVFGSDNWQGPNAIKNLGRALTGEIKIEGIKVDKALGQKILDGMSRTANSKYGGSIWDQAAYQYAKDRMDVLFENKGSKNYRQFYNEIDKTLQKILGKKRGKVAIDEVLSLRTGFTNNQQVYSVFSQTIDKKINETFKKSYDANLSKNLVKVRKELAKGPEANLDNIKKWTDQQNVKLAAAQKKHPNINFANMGEFNYETGKFAKPEQVFGEKRFADLPSDIQKGIRKSYRETGVSLNVGEARTQKELLTDLSTAEGRLLNRQKGTAKILNKILENNKIRICNDQLSNGKGVVCGATFAERDPQRFIEAIKRNKDAAFIINKPGLVKGALKGLSTWAKGELGPFGWIGSLATIDAAFGVYELGQGATPLQALDTTLWFLPKSWLKADEKTFKGVYERAGFTDEDFGEFQKWMKLEDLDQQYFMSNKQLEFMQGQVFGKQSEADTAYQKEVDALPDAYKDMGWNRPLFTITSEEQKTMKHPFYGPAADRHNRIIEESTDVYESLKDEKKSRKDLDYSRKLAAMERANRKKQMHLAMLEGQTGYGESMEEILDRAGKLDLLYPEYVHPIEGPSVSAEQMRAAGFADGGLTRTVAPDSGPMSQGLRSLYINDRDY